MDAQGNTYVTGSFQNSITFGSYELTAQDEELFVVKYNTDCEVVWAVSAGGSGPDRGIGIDVDEAGNSFITGYFSSSATFGSLTINSAGGMDGFAAKLNTSGDFLWAKSFGGSATDMANSISYNNSNSIVVTGSFNQAMNMEAFNLTSAGGDDNFVAKMSADNGTPTWLVGFGGVANSGGTAITFTSDNNIYISGVFFDDFSLGSTSFTSNGGLDTFLAKLNSNGELIWGTQLGGPEWDAINGIVSDVAGNCIVTGYFGATLKLGSITLNAIALQDIMVAKYASSNGSVLWAKSAGGKFNEIGESIAIDNNGNTYVTGYFEGDVTFGSISVSSAQNSRDVFVTKYDTNGNILWLKKAGGNETDSGQGIAVGTTGIVNVTGGFRDFPTTFGSTELINQGGDDFFLWKIWQ